MGLSLADARSCMVSARCIRDFLSTAGAAVEVWHLVEGMAGSGHRWQREDGHERVLPGLGA